MTFLDALSWFFGGAFLVNALPHLVSGTMGRAFHSPFAKPPGKGLSSPTVNVLWGSFNLTVGYLLTCRVGSLDLRATGDVLSLGLGVTLAGVMLARVFGRRPLHDTGP